MLRLAIAQLKPRKGAYAENLARVGELLRTLGSSAEPPDLVVLPEGALTGYFLEERCGSWLVPRRRSMPT